MSPVTLNSSRALAPGQGIGKTSTRKPTTTAAMTNSHCEPEMDTGTPL